MESPVDINLWGIIHGCHAFCLAWSSKTRQAPSLIQGPSKESPTLLAATLQPVQGRLGLHPKPCSRATANRGVPGQCTPAGARPYVFQHDSALCSGEAARCVDHVAVIEFMLAEIQKDAFLILCPDNDTPRRLTNGGSNGTLMTSSKAGLRCRDGTLTCPSTKPLLRAQTNSGTITSRPPETKPRKEWHYERVRPLQG